MDNPLARDSLQIDLLGGLCLRSGELRVSHFGRRQAGLLLGLLVLRRGRGVERSRLARLLSSAQEEGGASSVRNAIHLLRAALRRLGPAAEEAFSFEGAAVRLDPSRVWVDLWHVEQKLAEATTRSDGLASLDRCEAEEALAAELMAGYEADWLTSERSRLLALRLENLEALAGAYRRLGLHGRALDAARLALELDPYRDSTHRAAIEICCQLGLADDALRQLQAYREGMAALNRCPDPAVEALAASARPRSRPKPAAQCRSLTPSVPGGLALPRTPLFGREEELALLRRWLGSEGQRLVTIAGPAGVGKTRLALELASGLEAEQGAYVRAVFLAGVSTPEEAEELLAQERGPAETDARPLRLLLVDNAEHLADAVGPAVAQMLQREPETAVLVTSRRRLDIDGEQVLPLQPLLAPPSAASPQEALQSPALRLLESRARLARPLFRLNEGNIAEAAEICRRLDGLPLALELAAPLLAVLSPAQMLQRLGDRFGLLVGQRRSLAPRHRSLLAAVQWGHELLPPELQQMFARLGVFRGGFTLEVAERVCGAGPVELERLAACSLIQALPAEGAPRFQLLETLREFALGRLGAEEAKSLSARHAAELHALAQEYQSAAAGPDEERLLSRLAQERDNMRAALQWALEHDPALALKMAGQLWRTWYTWGSMREGRRWLEAALSAAPEEQTREWALAANGAGVMCWSLGDRAASRQWHLRSLAVRRELGLPGDIAGSLSNLAALDREEGDSAGARARLAEAIPLNRQAGAKANLLRALGNLAVLEGEARNLDRCEALLDESISLAEELGAAAEQSTGLRNRAALATERGDLATAVACRRECLRIQLRFGEAAGIRDTVWQLGRLADKMGDGARAALLLGAALAPWPELEGEPPVEAPAEVEQELQRCRALASGAFDRLLQQGRAMPRAEAVRLALGEEREE